MVRWAVLLFVSTHSFPGRQEPLVLLSVGCNSTCNFSVFLPRASGGESGAAGVWALEKKERYVR